MVLSDHSGLGSAAGWVFKNYAHVVLSNPNREPLKAHIRDRKRRHIPAPSQVITGSTALRKTRPPYQILLATSRTQL